MGHRRWTGCRARGCYRQPPSRRRSRTAQRSLRAEACSSLSNPEASPGRSPGRLLLTRPERHALKTWRHSGAKRVRVAVQLTAAIQRFLG